MRTRRSGTRRLEHPQVGRLELRYETLPIPDTDRRTPITPAPEITTRIGRLA